MKVSSGKNLDIRSSFTWLWVSSLSVVFWLLGRLSGEFPISSLAYVLVCLVLVLVAESIAILAFYSIAHGRIENSRLPCRAVKLFAIGLVVMNVRYFLLPVLVVSFQFKVIVLFFVGVASTLTIFCPRWRHYLVTFAILFAAMPWLFGTMRGQLPEESKGSPIAQFRHARQNIYLLSFDALVSKQALSRLFGYEMLPWSDPLQKMGFRVIENAWAAGDATDEAFTNILNMDAMPKPVSRFEFFGGAYANPAYRLFKDNFYNIQFLANYGIAYKTGPWVDYFYPPPSIGVCAFIPEYYGFFACRPNVLRAAHRLLGLTLAMPSNQEMEKSLSGRITVAANDARRWLTIAYFWSPGHTDSYRYRYQDIRERQAYIQEYPVSASAAIEIMRRVIDQIQSQDKDAVILVFGDHGAWVTRGLNESSSNEEQREQIRLDRRGVTFAVFPRDFCTASFNEYYDLTNLLSHTARCLAAN